MRALIVGYGRAGRRHARLLRSAGLVKTITAVDTHEERRNEAQLDGAGVGAQLDAVLDAHTFDIGVVATPPSSHVEIASALARRGIPCLIEKPVAMPQQSLASLRSAAEAGTLISVVSQHRFAPDIPVLNELLRRAGTGHLVVRRNRTEDYLRGASVDPSGATGVTLTIGIHWLDILYSFFGAPTAVRVRERETRFDVQVRCLADIEWPGVEIVFDACWGTGIQERPDELVIADAAGDVRYVKDCLHRGVQRCAVSKETLILAQLREIVAAVSTNGPDPRVRLDHAEGALRIAERLA